MATITTRSSTSTMMLCYTVIIALVASLVLSVDAIRCHQCNSHLDEDCIALRLSTPRAQLDNQYLKECEDSTESFCRKTTIKIDVTGEHRIVRSCGSDNSDLRGLNNSCFNADNEGFLQTICACNSDGCNAAPGLRSATSAVIFGLAGFCIVLTTLLRRSG